MTLRSTCQGQRPSSIDRRTPTSEELKSMSVHLMYEYAMLDGLARKLAKGEDEELVNNALLEAFLIHTRVLLEFFFPAHVREGDVVASDYLGSEKAWETIRGDLPGELVEIRKRVGKEVAHLTLQRLRIPPDEKRWNFLAIAAAIGGILEKFASAVDPGLISDEALNPGA